MASSQARWPRPRLSGRSKVLPNGRARTLCGVLSNGDNSALLIAAKGVQQGVPLLILQGSGRLSDYLPEACLARSAAAFNACEAAEQIIVRCGGARGS